MKLTITLTVLYFVSGIEAHVGFNAKAQRIDVSGKHAFVPPGHGDQRGNCPGLNALANHNYIPHNGVGTIQQFIDATSYVYGMGIDFATFASHMSAYLYGNLTSWSIGGPTPYIQSEDYLIPPTGISFTHNRYEGDASATRGDFFTHGGDSYTLQLPQFKELYNRQRGPYANYNFDVIFPYLAFRYSQSKSQNPFFFSAPFANDFVVNGAYFFIFRFMANRSAEFPEGILNREVLKSFYAITGDDNNLVYTPGHERIPENWYSRALGDQYTLPVFTQDHADLLSRFPEVYLNGGNLGEVNTFTSVDLADLTGGVYNLRNVFQGDNLGCFALQLLEQQAPDYLKYSVKYLNKALNVINEFVANQTELLNCPPLETFDQSLFDRFPGYTRALPHPSIQECQIASEQYNGETAPASYSPATFYN